MNRWLRDFVPLLILIGTTSIVRAACEVEAENVVRVARAVCIEVRGSGCDDQSKNREAAENQRKMGLESSSGESATQLREYISRVEANISSLNENSRYDKNTIAGNKLTLCTYSYRLSKLSASGGSVSSNTGNVNNATNSNANSQSPQNQAAQAQQRATQNQARADQARQGKRRRHEPENVATECIDPNFTGLYGGMKNSCGYKVWYTYCAYKPKPSSWLTGMDCEKQSFGTDLVGANRESAAHTKGAEMLYWFACKDPAWPLDSEYVPGQGVRSRCYTVGGN